jgi:hypothetical protein
MAICPISSNGSSPAQCWPICLSSLCLLKVRMEISSVLFPLPPVLLEHPAPSAACSFFSCFFIIQVLFFVGQGVSLSKGAVLVYPWGGCGNTMCHLFAHLLVCVSQVGLELASGGMGALLFSQCNMAWRSFVWAGSSRCQVFDSSCCFFSAKCGSSFSIKFLIYGAHTVCFCTLVAILDPSIIYLLISGFGAISLWVCWFIP